MSNRRGSNFETRMAEDEEIPSSPQFVEQATVTDGSVPDEPEENWSDCWARMAATPDWFDPYESVLPDDEPPFEWLVGGMLNACYNCVDRHIGVGAENRVAIRWESYLGETRTYTCQDLYREVNEFAAAPRAQGVEADDVVTLYIPMTPELPIATLACARIGAPHNVVFAGLSADALAVRLESADSVFLVTCDDYCRRGSAISLKSKADDACLKVAHDLEETVVVEHLGETEYPGAGQYTYEELAAAHAGAEVALVERVADDVLFLIHTLGTMGKPKRVEHVTGGYLAHVAWASQTVLDFDPEDMYLCTANTGWVSGHSYVVYGPLALGATAVMYKGTPNHPERDYIWDLIEESAVDVSYTAPTVICSLMRWDMSLPALRDLSSLRLLGTVGELINSRAWYWYYEHIGNGNCPTVGTWWQTETGGMMIMTLPGVEKMKPGSAGSPFLGVGARVVDDRGEETSVNEVDYLVLTRSWPGTPPALRHDRRWGEEAAKLDVDGRHYFIGDGAKADDDGYITVLGRVDDVINVSGHRLGTIEIESAIVDVEGIVEVTVVSVDDAETGGTHAHVTLETGISSDDDFREQIAAHARERIGPIAMSDAVVFTPGLSETRSGKITRRFLENIINGEEFGDTSALQNPEIVGELESIVRDG